MADSVPFPSPSEPRSSLADVALEYLDYFRSVVSIKVEDLSLFDGETTCVPSGWSPASLVNHLIHMERRWIEWRFAGLPVDAAHGDVGPDKVWTTTASIQVLLDQLDQQGRRTRHIVASHNWDDLGEPGPAWEEVVPAPLGRVLFHVLQEYARHVGHLDVARELIDRTVGESVRNSPQ